MNVNNLRQRLALGKHRLLIGWILGFVIVLSANHLPSWPAMVLFLIGCAIRFWASGYIKKKDTLAIHGPYRFTRNPLYLGSFIMLLGATISLLPWWLTLAFALVFLASYYDKIQSEEKELLAIFGDAYSAYLQQVPRFFPQPWRTWTKELQLQSVGFSWQQAMKNRAYECLGMLAVFYLGVAGLVLFKSFMGF